MHLITPNIHRATTTKYRRQQERNTDCTNTSTIIHFGRKRRRLTVRRLSNIVSELKTDRNNSTTGKFETSIRPVAPLRQSQTEHELASNLAPTSAPLPPPPTRPFAGPSAFERSNFGKQRTDGCRYSFLYQLRFVLVTCNTSGHRTTKDKRFVSSEIVPRDGIIMDLIRTVLSSRFRLRGESKNDDELIKRSVI